MRIYESVIVFLVDKHPLKLPEEQNFPLHRSNCIYSIFHYSLSNEWFGSHPYGIGDDYCTTICSAIPLPGTRTICVDAYFHPVLINHSYQVLAIFC